jgi:septal ring factor EnvC (AmiA/AmiB activator)
LIYYVTEFALQSHFTSTESALQAHVHRIEELQAQVMTSQAANVTVTQQLKDLENKMIQSTAQLEEVTAKQEQNLVCITYWSVEISV